MSLETPPICSRVSCRRQENPIGKVNTRKKKSPQIDSPMKENKEC